MSRRITDEQREEVKRLYDSDLKLSDIAKQTGISYSSVYGMTNVRQRVNPETGEQFKSQTEY
ncbi:MAG: helix-turn-helix domain-containing protein, partial [Nanoarchaeota archaeon]